MDGSGGNAKLRYALRLGDRDLATATQVLGVLYLAGAVLVVLSVVLPHPRDANVEALCAVALLATVVGGASLTWAELARPWIVHAALGAGTGLVSLCIYFAGVASGLYSSMFVWVVLLAACFFTRRAVVLHVGWIIVSWGLALSLVDEQTGFSAVTRWLLGSFVIIVTAAVMNEIVTGRKRTEEQLLEAAHLANHDPLTGLPNRRLFKMTLEREIARAERHRTPLAVIAMDLDKFKRYNDENGHAAGDQLLQSASAEWRRKLRAEDLISRVGGDEFVALLPSCSPSEAERAAIRLNCDLPDGCVCSQGIASWDGQETPDGLLARADKALYRAKGGAHKQ